MARIASAGLGRIERRRLSIADEVALVRRALDGIRLLVELSEEHVAPDQATEQLAPRSAAAIAVIVGQRLRAVERAARGSLDPAELIHPENEALGVDAGARLTPWTAGQRQEEAERQLRELRFETARSRSRRRQR
jgi:hypothetical protein